MKAKLILSTVAAAALSLASVAVYAKTYTVQELNNGKLGMFTFQPAYLHVQPGDSVHFVPKDPGHDSKSYLVPAGAKDWASEIGKPVTVTFSKDGVYLYECQPHHTLGMLGVIVVGKPTNKAAAEKAAKAMEAKQAMNKGRLTKLMAKVK